MEHVEMNAPITSQMTIVHAARELMSSCGYSAMSMRALARKVGIQAGSIYSHFQSKEEVLEEVLDAVMSEWLYEWWAVKPKQTDAREALNAFTAYHYQRSISHQNDAFWLPHEARFLSKPSRARILEQKALYEQELRLIVERGKRESHFKIGQIELTIQTIFALLDGLARDAALETPLHNRLGVLEVQAIVNRLVGCVSQLK